MEKQIVYSKTFNYFVWEDLWTISGNIVSFEVAHIQHVEVGTLYLVRTVNKTECPSVHCPNESVACVRGATVDTSWYYPGGRDSTRKIQQSKAIKRTYPT